MTHYKFCRQPKSSKRQEYAHIWRKVGEALEDGHEEQSGHTTYQNGDRQTPVMF